MWQGSSSTGPNTDSLYDESNVKRSDNVLIGYDSIHIPELDDKCHPDRL